MFNLFQTAIETLLFYHPAVWWVSSIVRQERENCCDDIAMEVCGRKNYATALANLESARARHSSHGDQHHLAMAADGGSLYRRIHRIVRPDENLNPLGRLLAALVAISALLLVIASLLPSNSAVVAAGPADVKSLGASTDASDEHGFASAGGEGDDVSGSDPKADGSARTYAGRISDKNGRPVSGVKVYTQNIFWSRQLKRQVLRELASTLSAEDGSYSLTFNPHKGSNQLVAVKEGYGPAIATAVTLRNIFEEGHSTLDLKLGATVPLTGRVVDTDGNPLNNVTVQIDQIALPESEQAVVDWITNEQPELFRGGDREATKTTMLMGEDPRVTSTAFPAVGVVRYGSAIPDRVTTSSDGSFRFAGLAESCRVFLTLSGPTIATRDAIVVTRNMKSVVAYAHGVRSGDYTHYGASPTLVGSPTQPIVGRVVDATTGQPLSGISVQVRRVGKDQWLRPNDRIIDTTNEEGRFHLTGAPLGGHHVIELHPPLDQPYFEVKRELPMASGSAPLECDFELPQTRWIHGRVTDEAGNPVVATMEFYPYRDNPHAEEFAKFDPHIAGKAPDDTVDSDENGYFRIKAIPGRSVLAAVARDHGDRPKYLPNRSDDLFERVGGDPMSQVYNGWSADYFDALVEVDFPEEADELTHDLVFKLGGTRTLNVSDNAGEPMHELYALGLAFPPHYRLEQLESSRLKVLGLHPKESRLVVLLDRERELGKVLYVDATASSDIEVRLLPCAIVTGSVVDEDGNGVENLLVGISAIKESSDKKSSDMWGRRLEPVTTEAGGKFRIPIPSGGLFRISAYSESGPNFSVFILPQPGARYNFGELKHEDKLNEADTARMLIGSGGADRPKSTDPTAVDPDNADEGSAGVEKR